MTTKEEYIDEKKEFLKRNIKPGDRIFFVQRHRTDNNRWYDAYCFYQDPNVDGGAIRSWRITGVVALVCKFTYDQKLETIKISNPGYSGDIFITEALATELFGDSKALKCETLN